MKQNILISITLMLLVGIIACSDTPYTGSMLTPADVDKYISYSGTGEICLENDGVSKCLNLAQGNRRLAIRIHPQRIVHTFYYEDTVILRAERQSSNALSGGGGANNGDRTQTDDDTDGESNRNGNADGDTDDDGDTVGHHGNGNTDDDNGDGNVGPPGPGPDDDDPTDNDPNGSGNTDDDDDRNGNTDDDDNGNVEPPGSGPDDPTDNNEIPDELKTHHAPNGWIIRLYYQGSIPANAEASLEGSGFVVTVFDENGNDITDTITDEAFIGGEDGNGFQFFVPTTGERITIRVEGLVAEHVAIFIVNAQGEIVSTEGTHTYQINPL